MRLTPAGWTFLLLIGVYLPFVSLRGVGRLRSSGRTPTRRQHLTSLFVMQGVLLVLALGAARYEWIELFPRPSPRPQDALVALLFLVPWLATLPMRWRWKPIEERRRNAWMFPRAPRDLWWWALVSLTAGIVEEIVYRGAMFALCQRLLGAWWAAVLVCVTAFALAHIVQGWRAVAAIVVMATCVHLVVRATGDLYTAMVVHVVYDFMAGVLILRLAQRDAAAAPRR